MNSKTKLPLHLRVLRLSIVLTCVLLVLSVGAHLFWGPTFAAKVLSLLTIASATGVAIAPTLVDYEDGGNHD